MRMQWIEPEHPADRISFTVEGEPMGKERPRIMYFGQRTEIAGDGTWGKTGASPEGKETKGRVAYGYTPAKTKTYECSVRCAYAFQTHDAAFASGTPVRISIKAYFQVPRSASGRKKKGMLDGDAWAPKKPDWDNIAKIVCDALNARAWKDDGCIVSATVEKHWSDGSPRIEVLIEKA